MIFKLLIFLIGFVIVLSAKDYEFMSGKYTLDLILTDSQESYPASLHFIIDDEGRLFKGSISYPTYDCKAVVKSSSYKRNTISFHEKMLFGYDSCSPSKYDLFINSSYLFQPSNSKYISLKMFDGEENVNVKIKKYKYKKTKYAEFRIRHKIKNQNQILNINNSLTIRKYISLLKSKKSKKIAKQYLKKLVQIENEKYTQIKNSNALDDYENYVTKYPGSKHISKAKIKIAKIKKDLLIASYRKKHTALDFYKAYKLSLDNVDVVDLLQLIKDLKSLKTFIKDKKDLQSNRLVKERLVYYYRKKDNFHSYMQAYRILNDRSDLESGLKKVIKSSQTLKLKDKDIEDFYNAYIISVSQMDTFLNFMEKVKGINKFKYYEKLMRLKDFGVDITMDNFFNSNEYHKILKHYKPNLKTKGHEDTFKYYVTYPSKEFVFVFSSQCNYSKSISRKGNDTFMLIFWWEVRRHYDLYNCNANQEDIEKIKKFEKKLVGYSNNYDNDWVKEVFTYSEKISSDDTNSNKDLQMSCYATVLHDEGRCSLIQNKDLQMSCYATVLHDEGRCALIQNKDLQNSCYAIVKHDDGWCGLVH